MKSGKILGLLCLLPFIMLKSMEEQEYERQLEQAMEESRLQAEREEQEYQRLLQATLEESARESRQEKPEKEVKPVPRVAEKKVAEPDVQVQLQKFLDETVIDTLCNVYRYANAYKNFNQLLTEQPEAIAHTITQKFDQEAINQALLKALEGQKTGLIKLFERLRLLDKEVVLKDLADIVKSGKDIYRLKPLFESKLLADADWKNKWTDLSLLKEAARQSEDTDAQQDVNGLLGYLLEQKMITPMHYRLYTTKKV